MNHVEFLAEESANRRHGECSCLERGSSQDFQCPWHLHYYEELDRIERRRAEQARAVEMQRQDMETWGP